MQRLGRAVTRKWTLMSSSDSKSLSLDTIFSCRCSDTWVLATAIAVPSAICRRAFSWENKSSMSSHMYSTSSSSNQAEEACAALYFSGSAPATDVLGSFSVRDIPGKGRGLVADRELHPGDLVMAVQPIAILHGPQDKMPSPDSLVEHLKVVWPTMASEQRDVLRQMFIGVATTTTTQQLTTDNQQPSSSAHPNITTDDGVGGDDEKVDFRAIVSYNAYGDEYEDLPAAELRGTGGGGSCGGAPRSHVGIWPRFSHLNHACAPNCVHYVVGSTMIVRAVQVIPIGCELLVSYLGRDDLAPRQIREAVLQSRYGFNCDCARCRTETELPDELQALLQHLYDRTRLELTPQFERLAAAAASAAERLDGGGVPYDADDVIDDTEVEPNDGNNDELGYSSAASHPALAAPGSILSAAERTKRALLKVQQQQQQQQQGAEAGEGSAFGPVHHQYLPSPGAQGLAAQLASLEVSLEECARQLHLAVKDLQEDDEAGADDDDGQVAASVTAAGRSLTRVQAAQAAAYQLLELLHLHAELSAAAAAAGGNGAGRPVAGRYRQMAASALQACWHVLDAISRGSELQLFQACKVLDDALKTSSYGSGCGQGSGRAAASRPSHTPEVVREAAALLGQSLLARYGRQRGDALTRLTQAAIRASRGFF